MVNSHDLRVDGTGAESADRERRRGCQGVISQVNNNISFPDNIKVWSQLVASWTKMVRGGQWRLIGLKKVISVVIGIVVAL